MNNMSDKYDYGYQSESHEARGLGYYEQKAYNPEIKIVCKVEELGQEAIYYLIHRVIVLGFYFSTAKLMRGCPKSQDTLCFFSLKM